MTTLEHPPARLHGQLEPTALTTLRRRPGRGSHDLEAIAAIIDEALVCHVGFQVDGQPVVLPTAHARIGRRLYLHGAPASRMLDRAGRAPLCLTFTLVDGLVLARSAAKHSMNYRSAVVMGQAHEVTDLEEKRAALFALVEHVAPGRSAEARMPSEGELRGTCVLALDIAEASAKVRSGPPVDLDEDRERRCWAGVVPLRQVAGAPQDDPQLAAGIPVSSAALGLWQRHAAGRVGTAPGPGAVQEWRQGDHLVSTDRRLLDLTAVHRYLSGESYWAGGLSMDRFLTSLEGSIAFGLYRAPGGSPDGAEQIGFARVLTDRATFAWLADVFVVAGHRGQGLGRWLIECVQAHPELQGLRRFLLATRDAHDLYSGVGFGPLAEPGRFMELSGNRR